VSSQTQVFLLQIDKHDQQYAQVCSIIHKKLISLPVTVKRIIAMTFDICSAIACLWFAFALRLEQWYWPQGMQWVLFFIAPFLVLPVFFMSGLYHTVHRHSGFRTFQNVFYASIIYGLVLFPIVQLLALPFVPRSIGILQPIMFLLVTGGSRAMIRLLHVSNPVMLKKSSAKENLLIYGAGSAGVEIAHAISKSSKFGIAGFIDDDAMLQGRRINGLKVYSASQAEGLIAKENIDNILLAMPSVSRSRRNEIVEKFQKYPVKLRMLPSVEELANGKASITDIKEIDIEDLLGRDPVPVDHKEVADSIAGKVVMVTGAGGSIGSELCRQLLHSLPSTILLVDNTEYNLFAIHGDLENRVKKHDAVRILPFLCDVTDENRVSEICKVFKPEVIYHAAAYKHVPMVEFNSAEGVRNNVFGTQSVVEAAIQHQVSRVVLVSTDKAVRPTNIMGASKRLCELIVQAKAAEPGHRTVFSMVRFGNVLGSSGSVIPHFKRQIKKGGPITITHKEITRYFMTIPEAAQLVIQAGAMATGGDLFLLEMGEPVKIVNLARKMVELSGLSVRDGNNPDGDIELLETGLRPGEKLYEELLIAADAATPTANPRIYKAHEHFLSWRKLQEELAFLLFAINRNDVEFLKQSLKRLVPGYQPLTATTDLIAIEKEKTAVEEEVEENMQESFADIHAVYPDHKNGYRERILVPADRYIHPDDLKNSAHKHKQQRAMVTEYYFKQLNNHSEHTSEITFEPSLPENRNNTGFIPTLNILIAEDDKTSSLMLKSILKGVNITIFHADNGLEAVELVRRHPEINIVLMDIKMPVMDGFEATKLIRQMRSDLPVIAQSAYDSKQFKENSYKAGCNSFISKPIKKNILLEVIQNQLKQ
jgi:FlaA1/EpsC-like NDP-sugar epimerase